VVSPGVYLGHRYFHSVRSSILCAVSKATNLTSTSYRRYQNPYSVSGSQFHSNIIPSSDATTISQPAATSIPEKSSNTNVRTSIIQPINIILNLLSRTASTKSYDFGYHPRYLSTGWAISFLPWPRHLQCTRLHCECCAMGGLRMGYDGTCASEVGGWSQKIDLCSSNVFVSGGNRRHLS
jgi:hypothetical protein